LFSNTPKALNQLQPRVSFDTLAGCSSQNLQP
jgi:hypothetical protein